MDSFKNFIPKMTLIIRDGKEVELPATEVKIIFFIFLSLFQGILLQLKEETKFQLILESCNKME